MDIERSKKFFLAEKKKVDALPDNKTKVEYIWQYYKIWIVGILVFVFLGSYVAFRYTTSLKENWFYITYTNTNADLNNGSELWKDFVAYSGYDTKVKNVEFNNNSYFDMAKGMAVGNEYYQMFVAHVEAGTLDLVVMERDNLEAVGATGRLMDLEDERTADLFERYKDRLIYCTPIDEEYGKERVPVGFDISDSVLMTKYHIYPENCAIGIGSYAQHLEAVEQYLAFILKEE